MARSPLFEYAIALPRMSKRWIAALVDIGLCALTAYLAVYLRLGEVPQMMGSALWMLIGASCILAVPLFYALGLYRVIFSQSGLLSVAEIGRACFFYGLLYAGIFTFGGISGVPRTVGVIQPILLFVFVAGSRIFARFWLGGFMNKMARHRELPRVLIYGAGSAGRQLAGAMSHGMEMRIVGFLDDSPSLQGSKIGGAPILDPAHIHEIVVGMNVSEVLLAMPSISRQRRNEVLQSMRSAAVHVRTLPGIMDLAHGRVSVGDVRELDIEDLLGRDPVAPDLELVGRDLAAKVVMVTGAGGSIGSELCRQLISAAPAKLLLVDVSEYNLYAIHRELETHCTEVAMNHVEIVPLLGSVVDQRRIAAILDAWAPDAIYHAAAYKHVPLVEHNPAEGVRNNALGTYHLARLAGVHGVANFVLISTDKAVRPTNVMGATKRVAELALQALNDEFSDTRYSMVRFGNVLGSSGSVVPLFRQQIAKGGPVTITDFRITRFFMTVKEAAQLVIQAGAMGKGGEVFLLDMGEPVHIADLARNMIELSGASIRNGDNPFGDIELVEVGLRPGEKLYEELLIHENPIPTSHPRIFMGLEKYWKLTDLAPRLDLLEQLAKDDRPQELVQELVSLVPEFRPESANADWLYRERQTRLAS